MRRPSIRTDWSSPGLPPLSSTSFEPGASRFERKHQRGERKADDGGANVVGEGSRHRPDRSQRCSHGLAEGKAASGLMRMPSDVRKLLLDNGFALLALATSMLSLALSTCIAAQSLATSRQSVDLFRESNEILLGKVLPQVQVFP